jgi:hypothetical protein
MRQMARGQGAGRGRHRAMTGGNEAVLRSRAVAVLILLSLPLLGTPAGWALAQSVSEPLALTGQVGESLAKCWSPPRTEPPQLIEVTVRLRFSRTGALMGEPRVAYVEAPAHLRETVAASALAAVKACTPLNFAPKLGDGVAGRMFAIRFRSPPGR